MHRAKIRTLAERRPLPCDWIKEPGAFDAAVDRLWFDCHVTGYAEFASLSSNSELSAWCLERTLGAGIGAPLIMSTRWWCSRKTLHDFSLG